MSQAAAKATTVTAPCGPCAAPAPPTKKHRLREGV